MDSREHLKRFRGAALFIIVMQSLAALAGMFLLGSSDPVEVGAGRASLIGAGLVMIPALMVWNGSIAGGIFLTAILGAELALNFDPAAGLYWPMIRGVLYFALSLWMLREVVRYRKALRYSYEPIGGSGTVRWSGTAIMGLATGAVTLGMAQTVMMSSPTVKGLLTARQISGEQYRWMYENDILGNAERVFLFAGDAGKDYHDGGNVLTNKFVGGWWREDDGELESGWIKLGEICSVEKTLTADDVPETLYTIRTFGEDSWLRIVLPKEGRKDREFLARMHYLNDQKMHSEVRSACDENREPDWDKIAAANGIKRDIVGPEDISADHLTWMRHNDFLTHKENVLKFYSSGNYTIATGGLLLTDKYFGGWSEDTDGLQSWWFKHGEICSVKKIKDATKSQGPLYKIRSVDNWFQFHVPQRRGQDKQFIDQIEALNAAAVTEEQAAACAEMKDAPETGEAD